MNWLLIAASGSSFQSHPSYGPGQGFASSWEPVPGNCQFLVKLGCWLQGEARGVWHTHPLGCGWEHWARLHIWDPGEATFRAWCVRGGWAGLWHSPALRGQNRPQKVTRTSPRFFSWCASHSWDCDPGLPGPNFCSQRGSRPRPSKIQASFLASEASCVASPVNGDTCLNLGPEVLFSFHVRCLAVGIGTAGVRRPALQALDWRQGEMPLQPAAPLPRGLGQAASPLLVWVLTHHVGHLQGPRLSQMAECSAGCRKGSARGLPWQALSLPAC